MTDVERYLILIEGQAPSNYSARSPDVPGCVATGETVERCVQAMHEALAAHVQLMEEHHEALPEPSGPGVYLERAIAA